MGSIQNAEDVPKYNEKSIGQYDATGYDGNSSGDVDLVVENVDDLKRKLSGRQIDLMVIGGSIGTALFVSIGFGLIEAGPGSMLIGFCMYGAVMAMVNNCMAEVSPLESEVKPLLKPTR